MASKIGTATGPLLTIFAYFKRAEVIKYQQVSRKFYNAIIPILVRRVPAFKTCSELLKTFLKPQVRFRSGEMDLLHLSKGAGSRLLV